MAAWIRVYWQDNDKCQWMAQCMQCQLQSSPLEPKMTKTQVYLTQKPWGDATWENVRYSNVSHYYHKKVVRAKEAAWANKSPSVIAHPLYTLRLNDVMQDRHLTRTFNVMSRPDVTYRDVPGNAPSYCCSKPNWHWTEAWYTLKFSTPTIVHIWIDCMTSSPALFAVDLDGALFLK